MANDLTPKALEELAANVAQPFESAHAMPPSVYTSSEFMDREIDRIFARDWYCVGRADALSEPGDYVTAELARQPVVVLRDRDGDLRALSNVCLHRMSTMLEGRGRVGALSCPYHGWTYNLDGSLRGAPAMTLNQGFCKESYRLPEVRCEEWLGWVFITLNPEAPKVSEQLGDVAAMVAGYDMTNYTETFYEEHEWDTNWKVLAENFMESYHPAGLSRRHDRGFEQAGRDGVPAWGAGVQLSHHPEG